jgi:hypothetical protein
MRDKNALWNVEDNIFPKCKFCYVLQYIFVYFHQFYKVSQPSVAGIKCPLGAAEDWNLNKVP